MAYVPRKPAAEDGFRTGCPLNMWPRAFFLAWRLRRGGVVEKETCVEKVYSCFTYGTLQKGIHSAPRKEGAGFDQR